MDKRGNIKNFNIELGILSNVQKISYDKLDAIFSNYDRNSIFVEEESENYFNSPNDKNFLLMAKLSYLLQKRRFERGAQNFQIPQILIICQSYFQHPVDDFNRFIPNNQLISFLLLYIIICIF